MNIKSWLYRITILCALSLGASVSQAQPADSGLERWVGEWELNLKRSTYGANPPQSDTRRFTLQDGMLFSEWNVVNAAGNKSTVRYSTRADGKDYPVTGSRNYDAVAMTRVSNDSRRFSFKSKGKLVQSGYVFMSADGKSWVGMTERFDDNGVSSGVSLLVFDKK